MKLIIETKKLREKLQICVSTIDALNINPALSGILIDVNSDNIQLTSSNGSISTLTHIKEGVKESVQGKVLVKGKTLYEIINKIKAKEVLLENVEESSLLIKTDNFSCELNLMDVNTFPVINFEHINWNKINFSAKTINSIINKMINFVSSNSEKIVPISGVLLDSESVEGKITVAATDSFHLASYNYENNENEKFKIIVSPQILRFISGLIREKQINVDFYINDQKIIFEVDGDIFSSTLINGQYPSFNKFFDIENKYHFDVNKNELMESIDLASVLSSSEKRPLIQFIIENDELSLSARSIESGTSRQSIKIQNSNVDNKTTFVLNIRYLSHILKAVNNETITFEFTSENGAIKVVETNNKESKYLIFPIRF
ncbi:MAG: DNA polymerase III subunit beta [Mycoplasma sp.]